jgi:hypothetical protein
VWVAETQYDVLGTRYGVRSDDEQAAAWVERLLSPFQAPVRKAVRAKNLFALASRRPGDERHQAYRDCKRIGRSESWTSVLDQFLGELNRRAVDDMIYFGVHAGVVASGNRTIALPGGSGAGKTTLVGACIQAGFKYVSDEALCLNYAIGSVIPYPKPLSLSGWSLEALGVDPPDFGPGSGGSKTPVHPEVVGGVIALAPPELSDLVIFEHQPGAAQLRELPRSQVVRALLGYSFNHYKRPAEAFRLTTELARRCQGWALKYEDPVEAAQLLRSAL